MAPCTHPGMKRLFSPIGTKQPHAEEASLPVGKKTASLKANRVYININYRVPEGMIWEVGHRN